MHKRQRRTRKPRRPAKKADKPPDETTATKTPDELKKEQEAADAAKKKAADDAAAAKRQKEIDDAKAQAKAEAAKELRAKWGLDEDADDETVKAMIAEQKKAAAAKLSDQERTAAAIKAAERAKAKSELEAETAKKSAADATKRLETYKMLAGAGCADEDALEAVEFMLENQAKKEPNRDKREIVAELKKKYPAFFTSPALANTTADATKTEGAETTTVAGAKNGTVETVNFLDEAGKALPKVDLFKMPKKERDEWERKNGHRSGF